MQAADFNVQDFEDPEAQRGRAFVRFFMHPVKNEALTAREGRPIYDTKEYMEIMVPGNETNRPVRPVRDIDRRMYAVQYAKWKASGEAESKVTGTHLSEVPWLTRGQVQELTYFQIYTLEQLAEVSDANCQKIMGLLGLRTKAKAAIEAAKDGQFLMRLQAELEERDRKIDTLMKAVEDQAAIIKELQEG